MARKLSDVLTYRRAGSLFRCFQLEIEAGRKNRLMVDGGNDADGRIENKRD